MKIMATKPRIQYQAQERPLALDNDAAIVRKKVNKTTFVNWANKTELTDFIDALYVHPLSDTYLYVICQCGTEYPYTTKANVPSSNVTCSCGRKIIEYGS